MRFLTDQDVYAVTVQLLRDLGHDVITAADVNLSRAEDEKVLQAAREEERIFVTRDRDFGGLVFVQHVDGGIVFLRMSPTTINLVHQEFERVLTLYSEMELRGSFVVVEPGRHRIRRPPSGAAPAQPR